MAIGTLYTHNASPRVFAIMAIAKAQGLDLDLVQVDHIGESRKKLLDINPLGQIPVFVGPDGFVLTECIPITLYLLSQCDTTTLLGATKREYYQILQWMSMANSDLLPNIGGVILPLIGRHQAVRKNAQDCLRGFYAGCKRLDDHLATRQYLVGNSLTIADVFVVSEMLFGVRVFHKVLRAEYPHLHRWFHEVHGTEMLQTVVGEFQEIKVTTAEAAQLWFEYSSIGANQGNAGHVDSAKTAAAVTEIPVLSKMVDKLL